MGAEEELARSLARFDATSREFADRRALREREQAAASAAVREGFAKQGKTMEKFIEHLQELGKRKRKAGGWDTSSATSDRPVHFSFGNDEEEAGAAAGHQGFTPQRLAPVPPVPLPETPPEALRWPEPSSASAPAEPKVSEPAAVEPPAPPARRTRRPVVHDDDLDGDDFSNHQWLR